MESGWIQRLMASTRGRIIDLLRRSDRTVADLADALGLTRNAIRSHMSALERDGMVQQVSTLNQGVGKPAFLYRLTADADALLPKAYAPVLAELLRVLSESMSEDELEALLREVGRRAAAGLSTPDADLRTRIETALAVLAQLGGVADAEEIGDTIYIRGYSCPLAAIVPEHPRVCKLAESLMSELVGRSVAEECRKGERPACIFAIPLAETTG